MVFLYRRVKSPNMRKARELTAQINDNIVNHLSLSHVDSSRAMVRFDEELGVDNGAKRPGYAVRVLNQDHSRAPPDLEGSILRYLAGTDKRKVNWEQFPRITWPVTTELLLSCHPDIEARVDQALVEWPYSLEEQFEVDGVTYSFNLIAFSDVSTSLAERMEIYDNIVAKRKLHDFSHRRSNLEKDKSRLLVRVRDVMAEKSASESDIWVFEDRFSIFDILKLSNKGHLWVYHWNNLATYEIRGEIQGRPDLVAKTKRIVTGFAKAQGYRVQGETVSYHEVIPQALPQQEKPLLEQ